MCYEKATFIFGHRARCLFGRLVRAMTINAIFQIFKVNINV